MAKVLTGKENESFLHDFLTDLYCAYKVTHIGILYSFFEGFGIDSGMKEKLDKLTDEEINKIFGKTQFGELPKPLIYRRRRPRS